MPRYEDQAEIMARRRAEAAKTSASNRAQAQARRAQAEQAARIAEQKRRFQAQSARAQAQARRAASEQAARIAQQQARAAKAKAADAARAAKQQPASHTVKVGDTAETIAKQYGVSPKSIADQVQHLRPGQRVPIGTRTAIRSRIEQQARIAQGRLDAAGGPGGVRGRQFSGHDVAELQGQLRGPMDAWVYNNITKPLGKFGEPVGDFLQQTPFETFGLTEGAMQPPDQSYAQATEALDERRFRARGGGHDPDAKEAFIQKFMAEEGMTRTEYQQYAQERGDFGVSMRYTGTALAEAFRLQSNDESYDHIVQGGTGQFEGNVLYLTSRAWNNGEGDPMWEQFSPQMQEQIIGLGYQEVEPGLWIPMELQPPDYGMGGFGFPGYGGGFGGGGDYEYLSRGGVSRRKQGGGESRGERVRIFPEGISPTHWRI